MPEFVDISQLTKKSQATGTEEFQVSATEKVTAQQIANLAPTSGDPQDAKISKFTNTGTFVIPESVSNTQSIVQAIKTLAVLAGDNNGHRIKNFTSYIDEDNNNPINVTIFEAISGTTAGVYFGPNQIGFGVFPSKDFNQTLDLMVNDLQAYTYLKVQGFWTKEVNVADLGGVPGVSYEIRYCLGTATVPTGTQTPGTSRNPTGWTTAVPTEVSGDNIYIWFIQARISDYDPNLSGSGELEGSWSTPVRLQGINGLDGMPGSPGAKGQIVYPAGIYSADTPYQTTSEKAPYVFDSGDNNYYVLNVITPTPWIGTEQVKQTPHEDAGEGGTHSWVLMESFDAIYANIGVFGYALVGSAVFWDEWVYSQQGTDVQGDASTAFERFNPSTPMGPDAEFTPNIALNFKTGDGFLANGKIRFYADGKVTCTNIEITNSLIQEYVNYDISSANRSITVTDLYVQVNGDTTTNFVGEVTLNFPGTKFNFTPNVRYSGAVINNSGYDIKVIYNKHDSMNTNLYYERTTLSCKGAATDTNGYASDKRVAYVLLSPGATMEYSFIPNVNRVGYWSGVVSIKNASDFRLIVDNWNIDDWNAHAEFKGADYEVANNIIAMAQVNVQPNGKMSFNGLTGKITRGGITLELSQTPDQQVAFQGVFKLSGFNLGQEYYKYMVIATGGVVPKGSSTTSPLSPFIPNVVNKTYNQFEIWMRFGDGSFIVPTHLGSSDFNLIIYDLTEALR